MPKTAKQYNYYDYTNSYTSYSQNVAEFPNRYAHINENIKTKKLKRKVQKHKKGIAHYIVSLALILFVAGIVLPFGFNHITKELFVPTPYKEITTDLNTIAFPTTGYLSNAWFMGQRSFRYSADKNAQMIKPKENVNMPSLRAELLNLMELYPTVKPAIYVWDYDTQNYIDINASKVYSTASIIKIPVLIDLFKSIEYGQINLNEKVI